MVKFFRLNERLEDIVFIRNHLEFETSDKPVPANSYLSITQGETSAKALEALILEVKSRLPATVMELLLEEYDFEFSDPLYVAFELHGNLTDPGSLSIRPLLVEGDEHLGVWMMEDGVAGGLLTSTDDLPDGLSRSVIETVADLLERKASIRVEARLDIAGILAALQQRRPV